MEYAEYCAPEWPSIQVDHAMGAQFRISLVQSDWHGEFRALGDFVSGLFHRNVAIQICLETYKSLGKDARAFPTGTR